MRNSQDARVRSREPGGRTSGRGIRYTLRQWVEGESYGNDAEGDDNPHVVNGGADDNAQGRKTTTRALPGQFSSWRCLDGHC